MKDHFDLRAFHLVEGPIESTRDSWRGRTRACRRIGPTLTYELVSEFDEAHDQLLRQTAPESFPILYRMAIHVFARRGEIVAE